MQKQLARVLSIAFLISMSWAGVILWMIQFQHTESQFQKADGWFSMVAISIGLLTRTLIVTVGTCVTSVCVSRFFRQWAK